MHAYKKDVFERIGLFDERYFNYHEETDFCIRAKRAGFKLKYCPTAKIWHKGGASSKGRPIADYFLARNKLIFVKKNFPNHLWKHYLYLIFYEFWIKIGKYLFYRRSSEALWYYLTGLSTATKPFAASRSS